MKHAKCESCHRREVCALHQMAALTLPWVEAASSRARTRGQSDDERACAIGRALRGGQVSPGFVEDWRFAGALTSDGLSAMIDQLLMADPIELAHLVEPCRHYVGPARHNDPSDDRQKVA